MFKTLALIIAPALALAACSSNEREMVVNESNVGAFDNEAMDAAPVVNEAPAVTPTPENVAEAADPDAQMLEDADAAGMTARVDRDVENSAEGQ